MINLSFSETYLSITEFPYVELPDFTVITGPNGAGKSHLLQAINSGAVTAITDSSFQNGSRRASVRLLDWSTMIPTDQGAFDTSTLNSEKQILLSNFKQITSRGNLYEPARQYLKNIGFPPDYIRHPVNALCLTDTELTHILSENTSIQDFRSELNQTLYQLRMAIEANPDVSAKLDIVSKFTNRPLLAIREEDILSIKVPLWGIADIFQQSFGRLFVTYRDSLLSNQFAEFRASKGSQIQFLSEEQFLEEYGPPPWIFVNECIARAGLDFEITQPNLLENTPYQPILVKKSNKASVPFSTLSSGEKILMSFAFCIYYSQEPRQISHKPSILLLDEIDAPLHPSMTKNILDTIIDIIVTRLGIKVIATTHSPSTVALAPEHSVYTMHPNKPGIQKSSKAHALNILTEDVPTMALTYSGRRQVFVECEKDAEIYTKLYKILKRQVNSDRSLDFIATGGKGETGTDKNSGCEILKKIVGQLVSAGNISVFGLVDWDQKHVSESRVRVLAPDQRDGLENVLFDPLLLALALLRDFPQYREAIGFAAGLSFIEAATLSAIELQPIVDNVTQILFESSPSERIPSRYAGGLTLQIDSRYRTTDDHALEKLVLKKFPCLLSKQKTHEKLTGYMVDYILYEHKKFIPSIFIDAFRDILHQETHI